jgi:hypothetical protein
MMLYAGPEVLQELSLVTRISVVQRDDCAKICDGGVFANEDCSVDRAQKMCLEAESGVHEDSSYSGSSVFCHCAMGRALTCSRTFVRIFGGIVRRTVEGGSDR